MTYTIAASSKKSNPLTWFILRVLHVIHTDAVDRARRCARASPPRWSLSIRCRERYEQLPQFIPLFCTESFLAFLAGGVSLLSLSVAFKCTYGLMPQLHFDQSTKPPRAHGGDIFIAPGLSGCVAAADKRSVLVINVAGNVMRVTIWQRVGLKFEIDRKYSKIFRYPRKSIRNRPDGSTCG